MSKREKRAVYLLMAVNNLLNKQYKSPYVHNILSEVVLYDGAECDGNCLYEDIEYALDEYDMCKDMNGDYRIEEQFKRIEVNNEIL